MDQSRLLALISSSLAALIFAVPTDVEACSCADPDPVVFAGDGEIPSDLGGVAVWEGGGGFESDPDPFIRVERWIDGDWVAEDAVLEAIQTSVGGVTFVRPNPFVAGDRFRILAAEVEVGPALPTIVGQPKLLLGEDKTQVVHVAAGSSCDMQVWAAARSVDIELPEALEPYRDLLLYETTVDGAPWLPERSLCSSRPTGRSWLQLPGEDLVAATCGQQYESDTRLLSESSFTVQVHAFFPGSPSAKWSTPEVQTDLTCPTECDDDTPAFVDCATDLDESDADTGTDADDAGSDTDSDMGSETRDDAGCATTRGASIPGALVLLGFAAITRRRRHGTRASFRLF